MGKALFLVSDRPVTSCPPITATVLLPLYFFFIHRVRLLGMLAKLAASAFFMCQRWLPSSTSPHYLNFHFVKNVLLNVIMVTKRNVGER